MLPRSPVVLRKPLAQAPRLDAHQRIHLRIEILGTCENLDRDDIPFEPIATTGQRLRDDETQQLARTTRLRKQGARQDGGKLSPDLFCGG